MDTPRCLSNKIWKEEMQRKTGKRTPCVLNLSDRWKSHETGIEISALYGLSDVAVTGLGTKDQRSGREAGWDRHVVATLCAHRLKRVQDFAQDCSRLQRVARAHSAMTTDNLCSSSSQLEILQNVASLDLLSQSPFSHSVLDPVPFLL